MSDGTGVSGRQIDRLVRDFVEVFGLVGTGWRTATRHLRLKLAVLLLSAEGATVGEVARVIGYGSTDAMARAFSDANMASPKELQKRLRDAANGVEPTADEGENPTGRRSEDRTRFGIALGAAKDVPDDSESRSAPRRMFRTIFP